MPLICTLPLCEKDQSILLENFLIYYNNSQPELDKKPQLDRRQFHFHEDGRIEEKKIIIMPAYTIETASGITWSLCLVEYIDHNEENPSSYKTVKWMPLDENGSPVQYFDSGYEFTITSNGLNISDKRPKPLLKAIDYMNRRTGLVNAYSNALSKAPENIDRSIPWEIFERKVTEICTGNKIRINDYTDTHHRKLFESVKRRLLDHTIIQEIDSLPRIPLTLVDPERLNRIEIMSPILTDDQGSMFVLVKETSPDGTMAGVSAISLEKLAKL